MIDFNSLDLFLIFNVSLKVKSGVFPYKIEHIFPIRFKCVVFLKLKLVESDSKKAENFVFPLPIFFSLSSVQILLLLSFFFFFVIGKSEYSFTCTKLR